MKVKYLWVVFSVIWSLPVVAQKSWNLKACIEYGLKNNRNRNIYYNQKLAEDEKAKELLAGYLPSVGITGSLDDNLKVQETIIPAGAFSPTDMRIAFTKQYATNGTIQLDQTIFDKSLLVGLRASKYSKQQADLNVQQSEETIIYNIANDYYQIRVYREQLRLLNSNLQTYEGQVKIAALQVEKGVLLQKELDKVSVDRNNTVSKIRMAKSNLQLSENQLKYDMGFSIDMPMIIDSSVLVLEHSAELKSIAADTSSFSINNRTDYQLDLVNAQLNEVNAEKIKAGIYPKLTAYAKYGAVGFGDNIGQAFSGNGVSPFAAVGLKLSFPIFDFYKRNAQYKQAKFQSMNDQEQLRLNAGKYRLEYENAQNKIIQEQGNVMMDKNNIALAESVLRTTDLQYQKGVTDMTDWLNAQNSLKESQSNYLNSLYNFLISTLDREKAAGTLQSFYNTLQ